MNVYAVVSKLSFQIPTSSTNMNMTTKQIITILIVMSTLLSELAALPLLHLNSTPRHRAVSKHSILDTADLMDTDELVDFMSKDHSELKRSIFDLSAKRVKRSISKY